jgi:DNA-binding CsgD family transcriptional regulator
VIMLDGEGHITGMTEGGEQVLEDLRVNGVDGDFPGIVQVAATKARWSRSSTNLTTRLRGRSGRWLRLHVSPMGGEVGAVALTVETARPDDLVRILLESYALTARETDIVLWLCRGLSTKEIAAELMISTHTVRDHVKAIYDKAGVSSRGELVADLFASHVLDRFHETVEHLA